MPEKIEVTIDVKHSDFPKEMQDQAVQLAVEAVSTVSSESKIATMLKREFDKRYDGQWSCIVGRAYGSYVTHDPERFIYFQVGNNVIMLFRAT